MSQPLAIPAWSDHEVDRLFTLAWGREGPAALAEVIAPHARNLAHARQLAESWLCRPLQPGGSIPTHLPTGEPVPPGDCPWPRSLSPVPGVTLKVSVVLHWAWKVVTRVTLDEHERDETERMAVALTHFVPEVRSIARALAAVWAGSGHALACIRHAFPSTTPPGYLDPIAIEALLDESRSRDGSTVRVLRRRVWRAIVEAGADPDETWRAAATWLPSDGVLPSGQWLPPHLLSEARARGGDVLLRGVWLPADLPERVTAIMSEVPPRRLKAASLVRSAAEVSLDEALSIVNAITSGELDAPPSSRSLRGAPDSTRAPDPLRAAIDQLVVDLPLHWALLAAARIVEDPSVETMAVGVTQSGGVALFHNPRFSASLSLAERMGVLTHEINHIIFDHCRNPPRRGDPAGQRPAGTDTTAHDQHAWILACECTANEYVSFPLPGEPVTLETLRLPAGESTKQRYRRLRRRKNLLSLPFVSFDALLGTVREDAARHSDLEPRIASPLRSLEAAIELVGDDVDPELLGTIQGLHPGVATSLLRPARLTQLPWNTLLRMMAKTAAQRETTRRFPNRRQPGQLGIIPGRRRRRASPTVLVAIDTSGSMLTPELSEISSEVASLMRRGTRVAVVQCDAAIHEDRWLRPGETITRAIGRGVTDLRPPFDPTILRRYDPDLMVYFTDGYGQAPSQAPAGIEVLWVLTGHRPQVPARWGRVVTMKPAHHRGYARVPR